MFVVLLVTEFKNNSKFLIWPVLKYLNFMFDSHISEPLGRPRRRWEDNIKMDFQEVGGGRRDWVEFAPDRDRWRALVGTVRDFRVP
jgi:hypothetical protein